MTSTIKISVPLLKCPGAMLISGPSHSGKTSILCQIFIHKQSLFEPVPQHIVYCHAEKVDDMFASLTGVEFHQGLPTQDKLDYWIDKYGDCGWVLSLDDMQNDFYNNDLSQQLLSRVVHHNNIFLIVISHSLFGGGKHARISSLNMQYFILTRSCRDTIQTSRFGSQVLGKGHSNTFLQIFLDATSIKPNQRPSYLFVNTHPIYGDRNTMLLTNIFEYEKPMILYKT